MNEIIKDLKEIRNMVKEMKKTEEEAKKYKDILKLLGIDI